MTRIILVGYMGSGKTTVGRQLALALGLSFYDLMAYMNSMAQTVYLKADPEVLAMHLKMGKVERPLIKGKSEEDLLAYIRESLQYREKFYTQAKHTLDVSLLDNYEKIQTSVQLLRDELGV